MHQKEMWEEGWEMMTTTQRELAETMAAFAWSYSLPQRVKAIADLGDLGVLITSVPMERVILRMQELGLRMGPNTSKEERT